VSEKSSPVCFRASADERQQLEAVAVYVGQSLSSFTRNAALDVANGVMRDAGGAEAVMKNWEEIQRRRAQYTQR
jgi:uncharacterized protein (DUF1778 family)